MKKSSSYWAVGGLLALVVGSGAFVTSETGCNSTEPTAIFLGVSSDMIVADDFDSVGLFVSVRGEVKFSRVVPVSPTGTVTLPASLSITQPSDRTTPVHIRVAGYKAGAVVALRDAISTVPDNQISVLRLPLQWLSTRGIKGRQAGSTTATGTVPMNAGNVRIRADLPADDVSFAEFSPFFTDLVLPCPAGQTSIAGSCADAHIDPKDLFPSNGGAHIGQVYGGAVGTEGATVVGGACFGVDECFADAPALRAEDLDLATCTVRKSSSPAGDVSLINFGLKRKAADCTNQKCVVALDYETPTVIKNGGWRESNGAAVLPPAVCERLKDGSLEAVLVSSTCDHKVASIPTCGPWSSVKTEVAKQRSANGYYGESIPDAGTDGPTDGGLAPFVTISPSVLRTPMRMAYDATTKTLWVKGGRNGTVSINLDRPPVAVRSTLDETPAGQTFGGGIAVRNGQVAIATNDSVVVKFANTRATSATGGYRFRGLTFIDDDYVAVGETDGATANIIFLNSNGDERRLSFDASGPISAPGPIGDIFFRKVSDTEKYLYVSVGANLKKAKLPTTFANLPISAPVQDVVTVMAMPESTFNAARMGAVFSQEDYAFHLQAGTGAAASGFTLLRTEYTMGMSETFAPTFNLANLKIDNALPVDEVLYRPALIGDATSVYFSDGYAIYRRPVKATDNGAAITPLVPKSGDTHVYALAQSDTELFWADENGGVFRMPKPLN